MEHREAFQRELVEYAASSSYFTVNPTQEWRRRRCDAGQAVRVESRSRGRVLPVRRAGPGRGRSPDDPPDRCKQTST